MGRKLMRVPMDFNWPEKTVWKGYINPYAAPDCPSCEDGYSPEYRELNDKWYGKPSYENGWSKNIEQEDVDALWEKDRFMHDFKEKPTVEMVNDWNKVGFGHDSSNAWICIEARLKKQGLPSSCLRCNGSGSVFLNKEFEKLHDDFEWIEPPTGVGFQLWETTSEGSPNSPVFDTIEKLCEYAEENCSTFADYKATKEDWLKMLDSDFVHHTEGNKTFI